MKKDWKYIVYLSVFVGIYVAVQLLSPKNHDWSITLSHADKNPYGAFVLNNLLPDIFDSLHNSNSTLYEILNDKEKNLSVFSLSTNLTLGNEDTEKLLEFIAKGNSVLLSAHYFNGKLADTLNLSTIDYLFDNNSIVDQPDSVSLHFSNPTFDTLKKYVYRRDNLHNYFDAYDTLKTTIVSRNELGEPTTLRVAIGQGSLILNSTPMIFANINMLHDQNHEYASQTLSYLSGRKLIWTEFYHLGRMEASTPLRFILSQEPLSWAYYIIISSILLLLLFESKRKQRIIPIIPPVHNTTLEFVSTIGNLYYQTRGHKNIADKKISFFFETLRSRYNLEPSQKDMVHIARKTGNEENSTSKLFKLIESIQSKPEISSEELVALNKQIEDFTK